jgi:hypothetical protein
VLVWWAEGVVRRCKVEVDDGYEDEWSMLVSLTLGRARESLFVRLQKEMEGRWVWWDLDLGSQTEVDVEFEGDFKVEVVLCQVAVTVVLPSSPSLSLESCLSDEEMARLWGLSELIDLELEVGLSRTVLDPR